MQHETDPRPETEPSLEDLLGPVIYSYTRAEAIADHVLIDVSETAWEAGFKWPVALTHAVWEDCSRRFWRRLARSSITPQSTDLRRQSLAFARDGDGAFEAPAVSGAT